MADRSECAEGHFRFARLFCSEEGARVFMRWSFAGLCVLLWWFTSGCSSSGTPKGQGGGPGSGFQFVNPASSPVIDVGQSVTLTVSEAATWSLLPGKGFAKPVGQLSD